MSERSTIDYLIHSLKREFDIIWVAGLRSGTRNFITDIGWGSHPKVVGHMNTVNPNRIQVVGRVETEYLSQLDPIEYQRAMSALFNDKTFAVIIADDLPVEKEFVEIADYRNIALIKCPTPSNELVTTMRYKLTGILSRRQTLHGVFLEVISLGVLITGSSSIGKSELALELISRGHRLIADDAPEFSRIAPDTVRGYCPEILQDMLEVRGLGVLNIREMYGEGAVKQSKYLRLIVKLIELDKAEQIFTDRMSSHRKVQKVLGVDITEVTLPVAPGRNLAVMVEAAARNHLTYMRGYDAGQELVERQMKVMNGNA